MNAKKTLMPLLLLSAVCATPALANYFDDPNTGTSLNIGSTPDPTSSDLRAVGDSQTETIIERHGDPQAMVGKEVFGARGEALGRVDSVDGNQVAIRDRNGGTVDILASDLTDNNGRLMASQSSEDQILAQADTQSDRGRDLNLGDVDQSDLGQPRDEFSSQDRDLDRDHSQNRQLDRNEPAPPLNDNDNSAPE